MVKVVINIIPNKTMFSDIYLIMVIVVSNSFIFIGYANIFII